MAADNPVVGSGSSLSPEEVAHRGFASTFRGFDPAEVRAFLEKVAGEMRHLRDRYHETDRLRREAENRAAHPTLDEATLAGALGEETARILRSAQEAAADIKAKAEENVERILAEAHEQAARLRAESEGILAKRTAEADAAAASIREGAESWAEQVRARATEEAEQVVAAARDEGRTILEEAQSLRAKVLGDLARRRKVGHVQVEQLRAGRERLLDAYRIVRRTLDEVTDELQRAESEARIVAETAANRLSSEPESTMEEMEAAIVAARDLAPARAESEAAAPAGGSGESESGSGDDEGAPAPVVALRPDTGPAAPESDEPADLSAAPIGTDSGDDRPAGGPAISAPVATAKPGITSVTTTPPRSPLKAPSPTSAENEGEERRLSSLRILRRGRGADKGVPSTVGREAEGEGVRIIRSTEPPGSDPPDPPSEPPLKAPQDDSPSAVAPANPSQRESRPEPAPEPETASVTDAAPDDSTDSSDVDELFARLRAGRESAAESARQVLSAGTGEESADAGAEAHAGAETAEPTGDPDESPVGAAGAEAEGDEPAVADADEQLLQQRDEALEPVEKNLGRKLKRALQDDQNDLLDRLRQRGRAKAATILPDEGDHLRRFAEAARDHLDEAAKIGAETNGGADSAPGVEDLAVELGSALANAVRAKLESALAAVDAEGDDEPAAADRVGVAYREWKSARIERLAGDHLVAAFTRGVLAAAPSGATFRWVVSDLDGACPDCDDNALAGPTPAGQSYPTGPTQPPAHGGCRCLLAAEPS